MEDYDRDFAQEVGRRIASMTPEEREAFSERIAKKSTIPTTPERVQMVLQAIPEVMKTIEAERQSKEKQG